MKKLIIVIIAFATIAIAAFFALRSMRLGPGVQYGSGLFDLNRADAVQYTVEEVARGLEVPWSIAFTSPDRMLVTERPGRLRVIEHGVLKPAPLKTFADVSTRGEEGLMSIALDPNYKENKYIYLSLASDAGNNLQVKVVRFRDEGTSLADETTIIDNIPAARYHAGCRIAFGPDGKLYITTGDAFDRDLAPKLDSLAGKILRINADGSIPADNPFPQSPIWSYGHRNPQGLAWDASGALFSSEHGPSIIDGPPGGDEINKIEKGQNYGWPRVTHLETEEGIVPPLAVFTPAEAPASLLIYSGDAIPQFKGNFFFGALVGEGIVRMIPNGDDFDIEKLPEVQYGRIREVMQGPDGFIYFSSSNRDGRGDRTINDDRIFRIRPE